MVSIKQIDLGGGSPTAKEYTDDRSALERHTISTVSQGHREDNLVNGFSLVDTRLLGESNTVQNLVDDDEEERKGRDG